MNSRKGNKIWKISKSSRMKNCGWPRMSKARDWVNFQTKKIEENRDE